MTISTDREQTSTNSGPSGFLLWNETIQEHETRLDHRRNKRGPQMLGATRASLASAILAKSALAAAPFVGGLSVIIAWQEAAQTSYPDIWRIVLTLVVSVFVTLCGVIYRDMNRRMAAMEESQKAGHRESLEKLEKLALRQERMLGVIITMALSHTADGSGEKLIQAVNAVLEKGGI